MVIALGNHFCGLYISAGGKNNIKVQKIVIFTVRLITYALRGSGMSGKSKRKPVVFVDMVSGHLARFLTAVARCIIVILRLASEWAYLALTLSSSTSNSRVLFGGMRFPAPLSP